MVKKITKNNKEYYICEACGFAYEDKNTAQECEDYCKEHKSCSLEITKKAIKI
jgi:rubrerythrin|tara:strand:- start:445 stop:603 length:159 start_codon:yes stop_codon:yes gene_type:complete